MKYRVGWFDTQRHVPPPSYQKKTIGVRCFKWQGRTTGINRQQSVAQKHNEADVLGMSVHMLAFVARVDRYRVQCSLPLAIERIKFRTMRSQQKSIQMDVIWLLHNGLRRQTAVTDESKAAGKNPPVCMNETLTLTISLKSSIVSIEKSSLFVHSLFTVHRFQPQDKWARGFSACGCLWNHWSFTARHKNTLEFRPCWTSMWRCRSRSCSSTGRRSTFRMHDPDGLC